ncbi:DASH complex subunit Spc34 [Venturia nashicola]|uniref:DASH complex subunit SPC34 n=1 Tax=Venturia nashicola TaxID=86259 RepID=A0A4Z1PB25_9PEZI|nr:DASH complex subunit Spc34 [Venturia nashicola]TLD35223.1 DASH complex subunit Spc34 [Venturia nashicola]
MALIDAHLESISLCSASIASLTFPKPKIFANALLLPHDITTLIRDTEAHERALFSVPPPAPPKAVDPSKSRRTTVFGNAGGDGPVSANAMRAPRRNTAVAAVLGGHLVERIRRGGGGGAGSGLGYQSYERGREKGEVDVDVLLEGAEKLCGVYPIPGAVEKIASLWQRHRRLAGSIQHYEVKVAEQTSQLSRMNRSRDYGSDYDGEEVAEEEQVATSEFTEEDMRLEEEEILELERKKRSLEERVSAMEKDINGVMR